MYVTVNTTGTIMKSLVVFAACAAICAASALPSLPGDNSHYVEGESRYIWMPDGEGVPRLVDLQEPLDEELLRNVTRNGANNAYWLYTRSNPSSPQVIVHGNANTIWSSNFQAWRQTKVIVHGWNSNGHTNMNPLITGAFLNQDDVNVIVLDWSALANSGYLTAASGVPNVGQFLGDFLVWLVSQTGLSWNNIHLVGFSLGAHVVGNAGRQAGNRCARVTGLDPAGPNWGPSNANTLRASDGGYVEIIHTDAGLLGLTDVIGNADFYPNGGRNPQPGCWISTCSHGRAPELFAASVYHNHLTGRLCGNLNAALTGSCTGNTLQMGNNVISKWGSGIYHLVTGNSWPY